MGGRLDYLHGLNNKYADMNSKIIAQMSVKNTKPSTGSVLGSIFGEIVNTGLNIGMMCAMQTGNNCLAGTSGRANATAAAANDVLQAEATVKILTPKLEALKQRQLAATTNYEKEKGKLEADLAKLNEQTELGKTETDASKDPQAVKDLQDLRASLTSMKAADTTFKSNIQSMADMLKPSPQGCSGKTYLTGTGDKVTDNTFTFNDFAPGAKEGTDEYKIATGKAEAANTEAKNRLASYKQLQQANDKIKADCQKIDQSCNDPASAITILNTKIQTAENVSCKKGGDLTAKQYETQKAEIMKKLAQLETDKKGTTLQSQIDSYEVKIATAQEILDRVATNSAANAARQEQIAVNNQDIKDNKTLMKANKKNGWKHFLGIRTGKKDGADAEKSRTAYNGLKAENAQLKDKNKELGG